MQESQSGLKLWLSMAAVGLFILMSTLDGSIVNIALPVMSKEMNILMNQTTWTVSIYLIVISGTLADKMDREYVTLFGLTVLAVVMFSWFFAGANTPMLVVGLLLAGSGFGMASFQSPNNALIMSNAP